MYMCVRICVYIHVYAHIYIHTYDIHLKLAQHCKSTILQKNLKDTLLLKKANHPN